MKHIFSTILACCISLFAFTQIPQGINYQAVIRDGSGEIASNAGVSIKLTIHRSTAIGESVYSETHATTTNDFGLVNVVIGTGTTNLGTFSGIDWKSDLHFMQVEVNTGDGFVDTGTQQLMAVPYALAADEVTDMQLDELTDVNTSGATSGQVLSWNGTTWSAATVSSTGTPYSAGTGIAISGTVISNTGDTDATNDVTTTTNLAGDVSGVYNNVQIGANTVGAAEISTGGVTTTEILDATIAGSDISPMSATNGQVLTWNGTTWAPVTVSASGTPYSAGTGISISGTVISNTGDTDASNDLTTATVLAGDVTGVYSNTQIAASAVGSAEIANDAIGTTEIATGGVTTTEILDATILGADINQMSATSGQVLEWNGTAWAPATDNGTAYSAGSGISITGTTINNTGDTDASNDLTTVTVLAGDVTGVYSNTQIAANAVGSGEIANDAVGTTEIANDAVSATEIATGAVTTSEILDATIAASDLSSMSASSGQVLKWNGSAWAPSADNGASYTAGAGISIVGTTISNSGDANASDDANINLSNLGPTAINVPLKPDGDNLYDLGSSSLKWQDFHLGGDINMDYNRYIKAGGAILLPLPDNEYDSNLSLGLHASTPNVGTGNTSFGYYAGSDLANGSYNSCFGTHSGEALFIGENNCTFGANAGSELQAGYRNCYFGANAGSYGTGVNNNVYIGFRAGRDNTEGDNNVSVGFEASISGLSSNNTTVGASANAGGGGHSTVIGSNAGGSWTASTENTFVGANSGSGIVSNCVCVGFDAGGNQTSGDNNTFVGYSAESSSGTFENAMALGYQATVQASNRVRVGNADVTQIGGQVSWSNLSDARLKKNVERSSLGLAFINKLQPVSYNFIEGHEGIRYTGFLAQDVEKVLLEMGEEFSGITKPENETDFYAIRYAEFVVPLVNAVQELNEKITQLESTLREVQNENTALKQLDQTKKNATTFDQDQLDLLKATVAKQQQQIDLLLQSALIK